MLTTKKKQNIIKKNQLHEKDTGSPEVQIAILSKRIEVSRYVRTCTEIFHVVCECLTIKLLIIVQLPILIVSHGLMHQPCHKMVARVGNAPTHPVRGIDLQSISRL